MGKSPEVRGDAVAPCRQLRKPPPVGEPLGGVLRLDPELVSKGFGGGRRRGETDDRPRPVLGFPHAAKARHGRRLPRPGGTDEHVQQPSRGGDLLDGEGLVGAQGLSTAGEVLSRRVGGDDRLHPWSEQNPPGLEEAGFGLEEHPRRVDELARRPEARGAVGATKGCRHVMQLWGRETQTTLDGELPDAYRHGQAIVGGSESHAVQETMGFGEEVVTTEGRVPLRHGGHDRPGGVAEDGIGEVGEAEEGQVIALPQAHHEGHLGILRHVRGSSSAPLLGELGEAEVALLRPGGDRGHLVKAHVLHRRGAAPVGGAELLGEACALCLDLSGSA